MQPLKVDGERLWQSLMDLARIGLGGHSFGAYTTQAVAGQAVPPIMPGAKASEDPSRAGRIKRGAIPMAAP